MVTKLLYILIALTLLVTGCDSCDDINYNRVEIVWPKEDNINEYEFKVVTLPNIINLKHLEGEKVTIKGGQIYDSQDLSLVFDESSSFEDLHKKAQATLDSKPITLDMDYIDGAYRANTFESLLAVTAYYAYNEIIEHTKEFLGQDSQAFSTPLLVGIFPQKFASRKFLPKPAAGVIADNAFYQSLTDTIAILGVGDSEGLPLGMNIAVFAHEFFHRVMQKQVFEAHPSLWEKYVEWGKIKYVTKAQAFSAWLYSGTNEGLCDVNALAYSKNPNFGGLSWVGDYEKDEAEKRDLNGSIAKDDTYQKAVFAYNENNKTSYYRLGTVLARTLFEAADEDPHTLKTEIGPLIYYGLKGINKLFKTGDILTYGMHHLFNPMVKKAGTKKNKLCQSIKRKFFSIYNEVTECPAF